MAKTKSEFVFPIAPQNNDWEQELGMTKREYFAAMALQGLMVQAIPGGHNSNSYNLNKDRAKFAVDMADALINELSKTENNE